MTLDHPYDRDSSAEDSVVSDAEPAARYRSCLAVSRISNVCWPSGQCQQCELAGAQANSDDVGPITRRVLGRCREADEPRAG